MKWFQWILLLILLMNPKLMLLIILVILANPRWDKKEQTLTLF